MHKLFRKKFTLFPPPQHAVQDHEGDEKNAVIVATGLTTTEAARISMNQATQTFAKPEQYTGNRGLYDSGGAKKAAKINAFQSGAQVIDPYTGDVLVLTKDEAKILYGADWQRHLAESDHIKPLEKIFEETKSSPWLTVDDIGSAANSEDNIEVVSRKYNNAKRSRTNEEYVEDTAYLESKGVELSESGKKQAIDRGRRADASIKDQLQASKAKNVIKTGHEAGKFGAQSAGATAATMSGIMNITAVIKGEKTAEEAIVDTAIDTGKAAVTGYAMSGGLTVVSHSLSSSSSQFLQALANSNVPGKVITAVILAGNTLKRFGNGEITTEQCLIELGEKGLTFATTGYAMAVGQSLIPIPIVGAAIGALVGSAMTSKYYGDLIHALQMRELEHQERLRIIEECKAASFAARAYRTELEAYLEQYFRNYHHCFDEALSDIRFSFEAGDTDGVIAGANKITRKLGGHVYYDSVDEFRVFLADSSIDLL